MGKDRISNQGPLSRRQFLGLGAGAGASMVLAACGGGTDTPPGAGGGGGRRVRRGQGVHRAQRRPRLLERLHRRRRPVHAQAGRPVQRRAPEHQGQHERAALGGLLPQGPDRGAERQRPRRRDHAHRPAGHQRRPPGHHPGGRHRHRAGAGPGRLRPECLVGRRLQGAALRPPPGRPPAALLLQPEGDAGGRHQRGAQGPGELRGRPQGDEGQGRRQPVLGHLDLAGPPDVVVADLPVRRLALQRGRLPGPVQLRRRRRGAHLAGRQHPAGLQPQERGQRRPGGRLPAGQERPRPGTASG